MKAKILTEPTQRHRVLIAALARCEDACERRGVDVAAAHHAGDLPACELIAQFHRGCERGSAGAFGEIVRRAKSEAHAGGELVLAELDDVVELSDRKSTRLNSSHSQISY